MTGMRNTIFLLLAAAAPPVPPPELLQLKPFLATLSCNGQVEESPLGPARSSQGTMTGKRDRPGFWVQIRYEEKRGAKHPLATSSEERWSYDPGQKRFIALLWDSFGGYGSGASLAPVVLAWMCSGESASPRPAQKAASSPRSLRPSAQISATPRSPPTSDNVRAAATRSPSSRTSAPISVRCSGPYW